jgi:hypothetical protein
MHTCLAAAGKVPKAAASALGSQSNGQPTGGQPTSGQASQVETDLATAVKDAGDTANKSFSDVVRDDLAVQADFKSNVIPAYNTAKSDIDKIPGICGSQSDALLAVQTALANTSKAIGKVNDLLKDDAVANTTIQKYSPPDGLDADAQKNALAGKQALVDLRKQEIDDSNKAANTYNGLKNSYLDACWLAGVDPANPATSLANTPTPPQGLVPSTAKAPQSVTVPNAAGNAIMVIEGVPANAAGGAGTAIYGVQIQNVPSIASGDPQSLKVFVGANDNSDPTGNPQLNNLPVEPNIPVADQDKARKNVQSVGAQQSSGSNASPQNAQNGQGSYSSAKHQIIDNLTNVGANVDFADQAVTNAEGTGSGNSSTNFVKLQ